MTKQKPETWKKSHAKTMQKKRDFIAEAKNVPCTDCGKQFPTCCMDFDHLDGTIKEYNIGQSLGRLGMPGLAKETAKCEVVCSNCHRIRTNIRLNRPIIYPTNDNIDTAK